MKFRFLCIILLVSALSFANASAIADDMASYRNEVFDLNNDSRKAQGFYDKLCEFEDLNATMIAYKGVAAAHIAKVSSNPFEKWRMLRKANSYFDQSIKEEQDNIEIRFLRYATQIQIPRILGMSDNLGEDKEYILKNFSLFHWDQIDPEICKYILNFMIEKGDISSSEKELLMQDSMLTMQIKSK